MNRVLHLDCGREMRGGQWQALSLLRAMHEAGAHTLLLAREGSPLLAAARERNLPCDALRPLRLGLISRSFDIVHAHDAHSHTLAALFARVPFVVSRRVAFPVNAGPVSKWKYGRPNLFLAVSRHVAHELRRAGVEERRIAVVYDGVPLPPEPASGSEILIPRTPDPEKGMALAEEAAKRAGVRVQATADLAADLPRARALLYLTRSEGLGSGILLAMAYGVTVIASKVGGVPEVVEDGVNGILVPNEPEAIAGAFRRINSGLGTAARETVRQRFTEERMVRVTLSCYTRVLANGR